MVWYFGSEVWVDCGGWGCCLVVLVVVVFVGDGVGVDW